MDLTFLYGASKPPLRRRIAARIDDIGDRIWDWGTLDDDRVMTDVDAALMRFCGALYDLAAAIR